MLCIMRLGEGAYGVPISREIEQRTGRDVAFGTVYATLERLRRRASSVPSWEIRHRKEAAGQSDIVRVTAAGLRTVGKPGGA
jgi:DNA-binding PadR family transcriptional regulator